MLGKGSTKGQERTTLYQHYKGCTEGCKLSLQILGSHYMCAISISIATCTCWLVNTARDSKVVQNCLL